MEIATDDSPRRSSLSFSLRGLLIAAFAVALASIVAAPMVRHLTIEQRWALVRGLIVVAIGAVPTLLFYCVRHYRVERRCGKELLRLPIGTKQLKGTFTIGSIAILMCGGAMIALCMSSLLIRARSQVAAPVLMDYLRPSVFWGLALGGNYLTRGLYWFWTRTGRIYAAWCENGVVADQTIFVPWDEIKVWRWNANNNELFLSVRKHIGEIHVPVDRQAELIGILNDRLGERLTLSNAGNNTDKFGSSGEVTWS